MASTKHPSERSSMALASLVAGILCWLIIPVIGAILAIVTGHMALQDIRDSDGILTGRGMAIAGLVLGYFQIVISLCGIIVIAIAFLLGPSLGTIFNDIIKSI